MLAVEVDDELARSLSSKLRDTDNVSVICQDALTLDPASHFTSDYKLVANLPYYVATPLIRKFLTARPKPSTMVVMVQKEVADTIAARPGKMGLLSVIVQMHGAAKVLFSVPPKAFKPSPKVTSAVIRIDPYTQPLVPVEDPDAFVEFVASGIPCAAQADTQQPESGTGHSTARGRIASGSRTCGSHAAPGDARSVAMGRSL